ncbi:hypothetical protein A4A49_65259 [Nicotiana attenuata]|uniref:Uncharacterized protein n=1 Tax=Nicotiana attenuata TaxID=49451 RepID=A0A1J6IWJ3_NICAT|nr:hypothetical protein A4A49_65259 [Nicotiana attenuata]
MSEMSSKNHKNESSKKIHADKKARRRELYRMMQDDKKESLLSRARARASKGETNGQQLPACSLINSSADASSSMSANISSEQYLPFVGHSIYETS